MKVRYSRKSLKFLSKLDSRSVERIRASIAGLTEKPPKGDIKPMQGYSDGRMRLRVGGWRVVYRLEQDGRVEVLLIMEIGNRGDIYK